MTTLTDYGIGTLVAITRPTAENARIKNKLALILSRPQEVEGGYTAYAVRIVASDYPYSNRTYIVYGSEIEHAPDSDRYSDENLRGEILAKRTDGIVNVYAVEVEETGEIVIKTRTRD